MNDLDRIPMETRALPHNDDAERNVLGLMLRFPDCAEDALSGLTASEFYWGSHQMIFAAMESIAAAGAPMDILALCEYLNAHGLMEDGQSEYLATLFDQAWNPNNIKFYMGVVYQQACRRRFFELGERLMGRSVDELLPLDALRDFVDAGVSDALGRQPGTASTIDVMETVDATLASGATGAPWFLPSLNKVALEIPLDEPTIIAGESGHGKSTFLMQDLIHVCRSGDGALFFSLEMSELKIRTRLVALIMGLSLEQLRAGAKQKATVWMKDGRYGCALAEVGSWPLEIVDQGGLSVTNMAGIARRVRSDMSKRGIHLNRVSLDHAQLIAGTGSEYDRGNRNANECQIWAKTVGCPLLIATQVTRISEARKGFREPNIKGGIPNYRMRDCDTWRTISGTTLMVYRAYKDRQNVGPDADVLRNKSLIRVAKSRDGGEEGVYEFGWLPGIGGFAEPPGGVVTHYEPTYPMDANGEPDYGDPFPDEML